MTKDEARKRLRRTTWRNIIILSVITGFVIFIQSQDQGDEGTAAILGLVMVFWIMWALWEFIRRIIFMFRHGSTEDKQMAAGMATGAVAVGLAALKVYSATQDKKKKTTSTTAMQMPLKSQASQVAPKPKERTCPKCNGGGQISTQSSRICVPCGGAGAIDKKVPKGGYSSNMADALGQYNTVSQTCGACNGQGRLYKSNKSTCPTCQGKGKIKA